MTNLQDGYLLFKNFEYSAMSGTRADAKIELPQLTPYFLSLTSQRPTKGVVLKDRQHLFETIKPSISLIGRAIFAPPEGILIDLSTSP